MSEATEVIVPVIVDNGASLRIEAARLTPFAQDQTESGGEEISGKPLQFVQDRVTLDGLGAAVEAVGGAVSAAFARIAPDKASVEFGIKVAVESGHVTTLIVKGSGEANLKVSMEWNRSRPD